MWPSRGHLELDEKDDVGGCSKVPRTGGRSECVSNDVITLSQDQINVIKERNGVVRVAIPLHAERPGADVAGCTASLIDRAVALVGIDHVAIEQEHCGGPHRSSRVASEVKDQLERRGYGEVELEKLWIDNLRRVFDDSSRVSGALRQM